MNKITKYYDTYKRVPFEITYVKIEHQYSFTGDCWTYYLYLSPERIPDKEKAEGIWLPPTYDDKDRVHYDYYECCWLSELGWHGGVTWYSKESSPDARMRLIKIGCDYQHAWDRDQYYNVEMIEQDAKATIEEFLEVVPDYKWHCSTVGGYWLPSEGVTTPDGLKFISYKGIKWMEEKYPDAKRWWEL